MRKLYGCLIDSSISYDAFASNPVQVINERVSFDSNFKESYLYSVKFSQKKTYLDAEDVKFLHESGVLIGSHTTDHFTLNNCTDKELLLQIEKNKEFLEDLIKTEIEHFAIPFGKKEHYNKEVVEKIRATGHKFAYSTNPIPFKQSEITDGKFLFPRIGLANNDPEEIMFYINRTFLKKYEL